VGELQFKLADLDHKVYKYQRDMVSEFDKYAERLLREVPHDISETVSRTIRESMKVYTSLYPGADMSVESCATGSSTNTSTSTSRSLIRGGLDTGRSTQPTTLPMSTPSPRRVEEMEGIPRSPHEREKEFQGLFTPRYLPLLDDPRRSERRSSTTSDTPTSRGMDHKGKEKETNAMQVDASTDTRSLSTTPDATRPPMPKRRNTDEASIKSDWSDVPVRRSALRRSSSASNKGQSPRRVRFDVAGEEVLPTSSPVPPQSPIANTPGLSFTEEVEEEAGSEQIEDVDEIPIPKRISSSQALRALSRSPLEDDGTQWTTVSAPPDGSASVATANGFTLDSFSEEPWNGIPGAHFLSTTQAIQISNARNGSSHIGGQTSARGAAAEDEPGTLSDDEVLDIMTPLKRQSQSPASMLSPAVPANIENNKSPTSSTRSTGAAWRDIQSFGNQQTSLHDEDLMFDDDQEEMFNFDENIPPVRRPDIHHEEESSESEPELLIKSKKPNSQPNSYSRSPAREIIKPSPPHTVVPTTKGIVGSYKGHPFSMPVVKKDVHDQAATMGVMNSFVGSVDGRSGIDAGDALSFSRSGGIGSFSGTPRSMSERLLMDDIMEAEEIRRLRRGGGR